LRLVSTAYRVGDIDQVMTFADVLGNDVFELLRQRKRGLDPARDPARAEPLDEVVFRHHSADACGLDRFVAVESLVVGVLHLEYAPVGAFGHYGDGDAITARETLDHRRTVEPGDPQTRSV